MLHFYIFKPIIGYFNGFLNYERVVLNSIFCYLYLYKLCLKIYFFYADKYCEILRDENGVEIIKTNVISKSKIVDPELLRLCDLIMEKVETNL